MHGVLCVTHLELHVRSCYLHLRAEAVSFNVQFILYDIDRVSKARTGVRLVVHEKETS